MANKHAGLLRRTKKKKKEKIERLRGCLEKLADWAAAKVEAKGARFGARHTRMDGEIGGGCAAIAFELRLTEVGPAEIRSRNAGRAPTTPVSRANETRRDATRRVTIRRRTHASS